MEEHQTNNAGAVAAGPYYLYLHLHKTQDGSRSFWVDLKQNKYASGTTESEAKGALEWLNGFLEDAKYMQVQEAPGNASSVSFEISMVKREDDSWSALLDGAQLRMLLHAQLRTR